MDLILVDIASQKRLAARLDLGSCGRMADHRVHFRMIARAETLGQAAALQVERYSQIMGFTNKSSLWTQSMTNKTNGHTVLRAQARYM